MNECTIISKEKEYLTVCRDVEKIMKFKGKYADSRVISLCKTIAVDCDRNCYEDVYFLKYEGDDLPIILTKEAAEEIIENPDSGVNLVNMRWFDRYK